MPELSALEVLSAIAKTGSLSAASREVGISQQAVSARLTSIEAQVGVRLVTRTTRGTQLTPAGEVESVNRHVLEYFGGTLEELKGWAAGNAVHADDLPAVIAAWKRAIDTGEPFEIEQRLIEQHDPAALAR